MSQNKNFSAVFLLIVLSLIWGTSFILIKQGLKFFPPDVVGALRVTAASLFLLPLALPRLKELKSGDSFKLFVSGLMGIFFPAFMFAWAQTQLNSSLAGILNTLSPVWTMIFGVLLFNQRFKGYALVGVIISFGGTVLLALSRAGGSITGFNLYALLIVGACAFYGANLNWIKFKIAGLGSLTVTSVSLLFIGPLAAAYLFLATDFVNILVQTPNAWQGFGFVLLLALMSTAVANLLFVKLIGISTPLFASSVTYIMPIVAVMWGVIDGEILTVWHLVGMGLIISGVYLANKK
ncbi:MAG: permease [Bacteroidota bacterium]|nr:MAG: membrane protein [Bacteroidetes bacterium OLB12]GIL22165.1 MAG: permease [Bacteroidota bacterium]HNR73189.1 DMT family transporter [Cyclobacteriaceae bacterium]